MAIYLCLGCDELIDDDWDPMSDDELCGDCAFKAEADEPSPWLRFHATKKELKRYQQHGD